MEVCLIHDNSVIVYKLNCPLCDALDVIADRTSDIMHLLEEIDGLEEDIINLKNNKGE